MKKPRIITVVLILAFVLMTGCTVDSTVAQESTQSASADGAAMDGAEETDASTDSNDAADTAVDDFGAAGAILYGEDLSIEQMMTYAIQDEYLARQTYEDIMAEYGEVTPFSNIIEAEVYHIELLTALFDTYGYTLPEDNAAAYVAAPRSFEEALQAGVVAEEDNIAMYTTFLEYDLPDDVRGVFEDLRAASENHLAAFERSQGGGGQGKGNGNGYGKNGDNQEDN